MLHADAFNDSWRSLALILDNELRRLILLEPGTRRRVRCSFVSQCRAHNLYFRLILSRRL